MIVARDNALLLSFRPCVFNAPWRNSSKKSSARRREQARTGVHSRFVRVAATGTPTWPMPGLPIPPQIPPEVIEEWWKQTVLGHRGLFDFLYQMWRKGIGAVGGGGGRDDDDDRCYDRWLREYGRCPEFRRAHYRYQLACEARANDRLRLCMRNRGNPNWDEPPEYDWDDVPEDFPRG